MYLGAMKMLILTALLLASCARPDVCNCKEYTLRMVQDSNCIKVDTVSVTPSCKPHLSGYIDSGYAVQVKCY